MMSFIVGICILSLLWVVKDVESLRTLGTRLKTNNTGPLQRHTLLRNLRKFYPTWYPTGVLDIGANKGMFASVVRELYPATKTKILMIEASPMHNTTLDNFIRQDNYKSEYYITVLSSSDNQIVEFYDSKVGNTGNSMFKEESKHYTNLKPVKKVTKTVDSILSQSQLFINTIVDLIKIDVQGAELLVLQGATKTLQQASFIQFEVSTIEWNIGGSCWYEIDQYLRSFGFYFYDLADFHRNPNAFKTAGVGQFDVLYVKPTSSRLPQFFRDNQPRFCGVNRNPFELPPVFHGSQQYRSLYGNNNREQKSVQAHFDVMNNANNIIMCDDKFDWYINFISGILFCIVVQFIMAWRIPFQQKRKNIS